MFKLHWSWLELPLILCDIFMSKTYTLETPYSILEMNEWKLRWDNFYYRHWGSCSVSNQQTASTGNVNRSSVSGSFYFFIAGEITNEAKFRFLHRHPGMTIFLRLDINFFSLSLRFVSLGWFFEIVWLKKFISHQKYDISFEKSLSHTLVLGIVKYQFTVPKEQSICKSK